jgi:hypothetical protein
MREKLYEKKGQAAAVNAIITLAVGLAVVTMIQIFTGVLSGQTYELAEDKIDNITDTEIQGYVKDGIKSAFSAQKQNADFTPIVGLAVITAIVLMLILGFSNLGGMSYGGRAL